MLRFFPLSSALVFAASALAVSTLAAASLAHGQDRPTASLLSTAASEGVGEGLSGAVDRLLRSRIDQLGVVTVQGSVALDIAEVQLALGCVGETPECLTQVAEQVGVTVLILSNLDRVGDEVVLSVGHFDSRDGQLRRVVRRVRGEQAETEILDAIEGALRELFDLPLPEEDPVELDEIEPPVVTPPARSPDLALPSITLATGAAVLGAAIVTGVLFQGEADAYAIAPEVPEDVAERQGHRRSAEELALATNVLAITGGVVAAAGAVWLLVELLGGGGGEQQARVAPIFGRDVAGLSVSGGMP
jgi:hypothetical protein